MNLKDIIEIEKSVPAMLCELKESIVKEIRETPLKDVEILTSNIVIIRLLSLKHDVWSPEYYIPDVQARYVEKALESVSSAHSFVKKLEEMIEKKGVKIGANFCRFNDQTIEILRKNLNDLEVI